MLYTKQSEDENVGEIFCKMLRNDIEKFWSSQVKPMVMTEDDKSTLTTQRNAGFVVKILPRRIEKSAVIAISLGNTKVLLIKNVTHSIENQHLYP